MNKGCPLRLHLREWGMPAARRLVCLHGVTSQSARFDSLAKVALGKHYWVLAPDLRGHGRSDHRPPWRLETHLEDVVATVGTMPAVWLGHSFGGRLALELAVRRPDLVERLVLLDPVLWVEPELARQRAEEERADLAFRSTEEAVDARIASGFLLRTRRALLEEAAADDLIRGPDGLLRYRYCKSAVIAAWGEMATHPPPFPAVPTLLVLGAESWLHVDVSAYEAAIGTMLKVVEVPGGHAVLWDAPEETAQAVAAFL